MESTLNATNVLTAHSSDLETGSENAGQRSGLHTERSQTAPLLPNAPQDGGGTSQIEDIQVSGGPNQTTTPQPSTEAASNVDFQEANKTSRGVEDDPGEATAELHNSAAEQSPRERFLASTANLPFYYPERLLSYTKFFLLQGVTRDCVTHYSDALESTYAEAQQYDNRTEDVFSYVQIGSAMMMSIAHGSNDVANAVGPWLGAYMTWKNGFISTETPTPIWILCVAGALLGAGFWFFGYHIVRSMGNQITQITPVRGFCVEIGAAITVLLASRLGLPISSTQCVAGSIVGVALMNMTPKAVNWKQMGHICFGWVLTLPCAGFLAGSLMAMALNVPHFSD